MASIFILCAGDGRRWNDHLGQPKQLITFGSERLIDRTARLVRCQDNSKLFCVTRDSRISITSQQTIFVSQTSSIAETILATAEYWSERNIFLLGDVFYSELALARILECKRKLAFFGRPWPSAFVKCGHGEMFGLSFSAAATETLHSLLVNALSRNAGAEGSLWILYQYFGGMPLRSSRYLPELLVLIDDYTNDIDTPVDYRRRGHLYERISAKGDRAVVLSLRTLALFPVHALGLIRWRLSTFLANARWQSLKPVMDPSFKTFGCFTAIRHRKARS